ncbi:uncharacterized protein LOC26527954 [Drosophila mojavensis]|uniref:Uncharacterized protein n=1 Tax=Drosophila mojavensis TaxID=7230 RepID=A0A0Q9XER0_DROMO|nr:uncharacterized protein LOC26527954 [Drosophila mojavensis]KRG06789.1 uncharacterized protein Dmoj_GI26313 [Drosophila mojavensis]
MIAEYMRHGNTIENREKRSFTGAAVNLRKLLKSVKRIFATSRTALPSEEHFSESTASSILTEEELQNWLNEQIESK